MNLNRIAVLLALLVLLFFVTTSTGLADLSAIQEQLRALQLKLIKEKVRDLNSQVQQAAQFKPAPRVHSPEPALSAEEMSQRIQNEIAALDSVVSSLKPRAIDEEIKALDGRISAISKEIQAASGPRLVQLQSELQNILADYAALQEEVKNALEASLKEQQAALLREQIRRVQEKILLLPRPTQPTGTDKASLQVVNDQVQKAQLKLLQVQMRAIQEKIDLLRAR